MFCREKISYSYIRVLFAFIILFAGISDDSFAIKKEQYTIEPKLQYKEYINIAVLQFKGKTDETRVYVKNILKDTIEREILSYKKIGINETLIDFKRSNAEITKDAGNRRFYILHKVEDDKLIDADKIIEEEEKAFFYKGIDIAITGNVMQKGTSVDVEVVVYNNIYCEKSIIKKSGTLKEIIELSAMLFPDIVKSVIKNYAEINVKSDREGALIYVDDRYFGRTPKDSIIVEAGSHSVKLIKDDAVNSCDINLGSGELHSLLIKLSDNKIKTGRICVSSTTDKVRVYLDSQFAGVTPVAVVWPSGKYRLRLDKDGYITEYRTVEISENNESKLSIDLKQGDSDKHYFSRTNIYDNLMYGTLIGTTICTFSYVYWGLKIEEEKAKIRGADSNNLANEEPVQYDNLKNSTDENIGRYTNYRNISLYTGLFLLVSTGVLFYLDVAQEDINIALYNPNMNGCIMQYSPPINPKNILHNIGVSLNFYF